MKPTLILIGAMALTSTAAWAQTTTAPPAHAHPTSGSAATGTGMGNSPPPAASDASGANKASNMQADGAGMAGGNALALGLLAVVDDNEIAAAKQALGKKVSAPVADYARMMQKEHTDNLAKTKALGALSKDADVQAQKKKGSDELKMLGAKSGKAYEVAYVDAMVKGHTEALTLIDTRLLPMASSAAVKQHLTDTRAHVAAHLQAAQALKASVAS